MSEILHANIFFFITGIAVIVFTLLLSVALYHLIRILTAVRRIVDRVEAGTATIADDIEQVRTYVMEESFLSRFFSRVHRDVDDDHEHDHEEEATPRRSSSVRANKSPSKIKTELKIKHEE